MSPSTMTLAEAGLTPDAPHRRKDVNKTSRGGEVCVLRKRNCGCCCENEADYSYGMSKIKIQFASLLEGLLREERGGRGYAIQVCQLWVSHDAIEGKTSEPREAFREAARAQGGRRGEVSRSEAKDTPRSQSVRGRSGENHPP